MALMFSRLAHNFAKNGYFPTDEVTLGRILQAIDTNAENVAILDPCCGEGVAIAELKNHLQGAGAQVTAYGVEFNEERAWHAKSLIDTVAHTDFQNMSVSPRQFGALFLNPPYGDLVADTAALDKAQGGRKRLEKEFYRRTHTWLATDGILILIVPHTVLDAEFSGWIAKHYREVRVFMAPEQQFKQCVLFGIKRRSDRPDPKVAKQLEALSRGELVPELPEHWSGAIYQVPQVPVSPIQFVALQMDPRELANELQKMQRSSLWPQFAMHFGAHVQAHRRPLRSLTDWHLALALAAGQISGVVTSRTGRKLLVKGDTFKRQSQAITYEPTGSKVGGMREIRVLTDRFVPTIRAIDFTPGLTYGRILTIQ